MPTATTEETSIEVSPAEKSKTIAPRAPINVPGVSFVKTGEKVSPLKFERMKFSKGRNSLISFLSPDPMVIKSHYIKDNNIGSILTFNEVERDYGNPSVKYVYPILVYETNEKGKIVGYGLTLKLLAVGPSAYEPLCNQLSMLEDAGKDLTSVDMLVQCLDETYQKINFTASPSKALEKFEDKTQYGNLVDYWNANAQDAYKTIARYVTPEEYRKLKEGGDGDSSPLPPSRPAVAGSRSYDDFMGIE